MKIGQDLLDIYGINDDSWVQIEAREEGPQRDQSESTRQDSRHTNNAMNKPYVVVVYHVTIVASGHKWLKNYCNRLRSTHCRKYSLDMQTRLLR